MTTATKDAASSHHLAAFRSWEKYSSAGRLDPHLTATGILRSAWPDHHVVRTSPDKCDLQGFADAGFARWRDDADDLGLRDAQRDFVSAGARTDKDPGCLGDHVTFGRVAYSWEGHEFIVYQLEYAENIIRSPEPYLFVLASGGAAGAGGHRHEDIDALLLACGRWTKELHEEIFVFDSGMWQKDEDLYKSVQSASLDDVVLDPATKAKLVDDVQGFFDNQALYESFKVPWKRGVSTY